MRKSHEFPFFEKETTIWIHLDGGIINPSELMILSQIASDNESKYLYMGRRQHFYLIVPNRLRNKTLNDLELNGFKGLTDISQISNISSSACAIDIFGKNSWASEGIFQEILYSFDYQPKLKINIVELNQSMVSLFGGDLNFINSNLQNYWFLYLKNTKTGQFIRFPELIYSTDIALVSKEIEKHWNEESDISAFELQQKLKLNISYICQTTEEEIQIPRFRFSYYEGLNSYENKFWLGIYRRKERIRASVLNEIASLLQATNAGYLYLTPWKSLIVKNIQEKDRIHWEMLLGKNGYNIRHSCTDLIWKTPDLDIRAYKIKKKIVQKLDFKDVRTFGITISLKTDKSKSDHSVIQVNEFGGFNIFGRKIMPTYNITYSEDFNPNNPRKVGFMKSLAAFDLADSIKELCKMYYSQLNYQRENYSFVPNSNSKSSLKKVFACQDCGTVYDPEYGDHMAGIEPNTPFEELSSLYECPICSSGKEKFREIELVLDENNV